MNIQTQTLVRIPSGLFVAILFFANCSATTPSSDILPVDTEFELVTYSTPDGGEIEGSFFKTEGNLVVIFAHGAVFNKESWYFLAEKLQAQNISSLSIDFRGYGNSKAGSTNKKSNDILGAVDYLKSVGYNRIAIVGGSMGGAAVLAALDEKTDPVILKTVLLAPAGGNPIQSTSIDKLFIVSRNEGLFNRVNTLFDESSDSKELKIYEGSAHAQHMFKEDYAEELTERIIMFLKE